MEINGRNFTIGADPEIFVGRGGSFIPAVNMVPGNKKTPHKVERGAVQVDGMALEFNIDPASSYEEFQGNLDIVQAQLKAMIGDVEFLDVASVIFSEEFLKGVPYENVQLGCEPDFNGYTVSVNPAPNEQSLMRTAGGHVHIGGFSVDRGNRRGHMADMARLTRLMDQEVGVYSVLWDMDDRRRVMYGKAGCFRPKPYGMEYRSMSNAWIFSKDLVRFVYDATFDAVQRFVDGEDAASATPRDIMNNSDRRNEFFTRNQKAERVMDIMGVAA